MAKETESQLEITRSNAGVWSIAPRTGRNWSSPVVPRSIEPVYGDIGADLDFAGARSASQRFEIDVNVHNTRNIGNMAGLLRAFITRVSTVDRFLFAWPQPMGNDVVTAAPRLSANAAAGAFEVRCSASTPPPVGNLIQFETNGKLHLVEYAPVGRQTAAWTLGVYPRLPKAAASGARLVVVPVGYARLAALPEQVWRDSIVLSARLTVREALS